jgi:hypothetical protein
MVASITGPLHVTVVNNDALETADAFHDARLSRSTTIAGTTSPRARPISCAPSGTLGLADRLETLAPARRQRVSLNY